MTKPIKLPEVHVQLPKVEIKVPSREQLQQTVASSIAAARHSAEELVERLQQAMPVPKGSRLGGVVFNLELQGTVTEVNLRPKDFLGREQEPYFMVRLHSGGRPQKVILKDTTWYEVLRNIDGAWTDQVPDPAGGRKDGLVGQAEKYLRPGELVTIKGLQYSAEDRYEAGSVILAGSGPGKYNFENDGWWASQMAGNGNRWLNALFGPGKTEFTVEDFEKGYRTYLSHEGLEVPGRRDQEVATLSRLIYGLASTYMTTGDPKFLSAAKAGIDFQRKHFTMDAAASDGTPTRLWAFARQPDNDNAMVRASRNEDDKDTIPLYEQIYAVAGMAMYFRATGDRSVLNDIQLTMNSFEKYFHDNRPNSSGGYFSHISPETMRYDDPSLKDNRSRKNWNSVGDHIPAYLINLMSALGPVDRGPDADPELNRLRESAERMLLETSSLIVDKFPGRDGSVYVQERFFEDWAPDKNFRWQQDRAVIGHNFKIAWNLSRVGFYLLNQAQAMRAAGDERGAVDYERRANAAFSFALKLGSDMNKVGVNPASGSVYDAVERSPTDSKKTRFAWDNHSTFWQQEQGQLANLILAGVAPSDPRFVEMARQIQQTWNVDFVDKDTHGVNFMIESTTGFSEVRGDDGMMGGHAISGYHAFENAFLSLVYASEHITGRPFPLHFQLAADRVQDSVPVAPDFIKQGALQIESYKLNGTEYPAPTDPSRLVIDLPSELKGQPVHLEVVLKAMLPEGAVGR